MTENKHTGDTGPAGIASGLFLKTSYNIINLLQLFLHPMSTDD